MKANITIIFVYILLHIWVLFCRFIPLGFLLLICFVCCVLSYVYFSLPFFVLFLLFVKCYGKVLPYAKIIYVVYAQRPLLMHWCGLCVHVYVKTSWHGNAFHISGPVRGESSGHQWIALAKNQWRAALKFSSMLPLTSCWTNRRVPVIWQAMTLIWCPCNVGNWLIAISAQTIFITVALSVGILSYIVKYNYKYITASIYTQENVFDADAAKLDHVCFGTAFTNTV